LSKLQTIPPKANKTAKTRKATAQAGVWRGLLGRGEQVPVVVEQIDVEQERSELHFALIGSEGVQSKD